MKSIMLVTIMLTSSPTAVDPPPPDPVTIPVPAGASSRPGSRGDTSGRSLPKGPEAIGTETKRPAPKKLPAETVEFIFKRMDSNHDGSISLKEFKVAFPRLRQSFTRSSSQGRTRGASGFRPSEKGAYPKGNIPSRGKSYRGSRGRSGGSK
jgi:hypothetical protein